MIRTIIDIETRSACDLKRCGAYVYAEHPTTTITHVGFKIGDSVTRMWRPIDRSPMPADLRAVLDDTLVAHNAGFERLVLSGMAGTEIGFPDLSDTARWDCTAARSACLGLPRDLDGVCGALDLPVKKDKLGHALMLRVSKPKPRKRDAPSDAPLVWWDDETRMARMDAYCARDVDAEYAVDRFLPALRREERDAWLVTESINDRGIQVDSALLAAIVAMIEAAEAEVNARISAVTSGAVPRVSDTGALAAWLLDQGVLAAAAGVAKDIVAAMLTDSTLPPRARAALELRRDGGGAASKKYKSISARLSPDGKIRGVLVYAGAASTARWSSRGAQLQNMPRASIEGLNGAIIDLLTGDYTLAEITEVYQPPLILAGMLLRPLFVASHA